MASLRGVTQVWTALDAAGAGGASAEAHIGSKPYVAVLIANDSGGPLNFGIEVASAPGMSAGKNEASDPALVWHTYYSWNDPGNPVVITVADGAPVAFDLSPFAPELVRLTCTEGFSAGEVVASVTASGPN